MAKLHVYIKGNYGATAILSYTGIDFARYFAPIVAVSGVVAVIHAVAIFGPCYWWLASTRRLGRVSAGPSATLVETPEAESTAPRSRFQRIQDKLAEWDRVLESACGVDSYELLVFVEIGLQSFQAYKMSNLVATHWINHLMVLAVVVNCWIVPAVSVAFRKKPPSYVRVAQLALDAVIEVVYGMAIPFAIFYPYYRDASHILYDTPYIGNYMDTWWVNASAENRQLYVTSWIDFIAKVAPGFSLLLRLYAFQSQRMEHEVRTRSATLASDASPTTRKKRVAIGVMALWGLVVLAVHLAASAISASGTDPGCLLEPIPIGSTRYSCTVLEVSCTQKRIAGSKGELDSALSKVDPLRLKGLIFSHCEALAMPPRLKAFPNLVIIKIHNSSIAEWGEDAALTAHEHPVLQAVLVTLTNMSRIPDGLLSADAPRRLTVLQLCGTNLTGLPDDLFTKLRAVVQFFLELSPGITEVPRALQAKVAPPVISLSSNSLTALPDDIFVDRKFRLFLVSGNPLVSLPQSVGTAAPSATVSVSFTPITTLPASWATATARYAGGRGGVLAQGTPLCASLEELRAHSPGSSDNAARTLPWIRCGARPRRLRWRLRLATIALEQVLRGATRERDALGALVARSGEREELLGRAREERRTVLDHGLALGRRAVQLLLVAAQELPHGRAEALEHARARVERGARGRQLQQRHAAEARVRREHGRHERAALAAADHQRDVRERHRVCSSERVERAAHEPGHVGSVQRAARVLPVGGAIRREQHEHVHVAAALQAPGAPEVEVRLVREEHALAGGGDARESDCELAAHTRRLLGRERERRIRRCAPQCVHGAAQALVHRLRHDAQPELALQRLDHFAQRREAVVTEQALEERHVLVRDLLCALAAPRVLWGRRRLLQVALALLTHPHPSGFVVDFERVRRHLPVAALARDSQDARLRPHPLERLRLRHHGRRSAAEGRVWVLRSTRRHRANDSGRVVSLSFLAATRGLRRPLRSRRAVAACTNTLHSCVPSVHGVLEWSLGRRRSRSAAVDAPHRAHTLARCGRSATSTHARTRACVRGAAAQPPAPPRATTTAHIHARARLRRSGSTTTTSSLRPYNGSRSRGRFDSFYV
ncbi:hypothetical protein PybrP1_003014, partial [[Pythium] brassicae (nom. inval.)]